MKSPTWRERARPIIAEVLAETQDKPEKEIRKALRAAYPFGERDYYPYEAWLLEVRAQRGLSKRKPKPGYEPVEGQQALLLEVTG